MCLGVSQGGGHHVGLTGSLARHSESTMRCPMRWFGRLFMLGTVGAVTIMMAQPAYATASHSDLTIRVDQAIGAVGSAIEIHDHLQDLGPESTNTSAFTIETIAPAGAELTDPYNPSACTWIKAKTDVRCYYTAQLWWKYNSPTPNDYVGIFGIKILKPITAPGKIILAVDPACVSIRTPVTTLPTSLSTVLDRRISRPLRPALGHRASPAPSHRSDPAPSRTLIRHRVRSRSR